MFSLSLSLLLAAAAVRAGQSTVSVTSATAWLNSEDGETPCAVWAKMRSVCDPSSASDVSPLSTLGGLEYPPPTSASTTVDCDCNGDAYDLMAACAYVQDGGYTWPTLSEWQGSCPAYTDSFASSYGYEYDLTAAGEVLSALPIFSSVYRPFTTFVPSDACDNSGHSVDCYQQFLSSGSGSSYGSGSSNGYRAAVVANLATARIVAAIFVMIPMLCSIAALIICCVRNKNRKKFYGPLAAHYANGGLAPWQNGSASSSGQFYEQSAPYNYDQNSKV